MVSEIGAQLGKANLLVFVLILGAIFLRFGVTRHYLMTAIRERSVSIYRVGNNQFRLTRWYRLPGKKKETFVCKATLIRISIHAL